RGGPAVGVGLILLAIGPLRGVSVAIGVGVGVDEVVGRAHRVVYAAVHVLDAELEVVARGPEAVGRVRDLGAGRPPGGVVVVPVVGRARDLARVEVVEVGAHLGLAGGDGAAVVVAPEPGEAGLQGGLGRQHARIHEVGSGVLAGVDRDRAGRGVGARGV